MSCFQQLVEKKYEIRTFYLDGDFYSMVIFSQRREDAKLDFRNYDFNDPDRFLPFNLPKDFTMRPEIGKKLELIQESVVPYNLKVKTKNIFL